MAGRVFTTDELVDDLRQMRHHLAGLESTAGRKWSELRTECQLLASAILAKQQPVEISDADTAAALEEIRQEEAGQFPRLH